MHLPKKESESFKVTPTLGAFLILLLLFVVACGSSATSTPPPQAADEPTATTGPGPTATTGPGPTATAVPVAQPQSTEAPATSATAVSKAATAANVTAWPPLKMTSPRTQGVPPRPSPHQCSGMIGQRPVHQDRLTTNH